MSNSLIKLYDRLSETACDIIDSAEKVDAYLALFIGDLMVALLLQVEEWRQNLEDTQ